MVTSPLQIMGTTITSPFTGLGNVFRNLTADERTLIELEEENARLAARNVELEEAEQSAQRLQSLLELRDAHSLQSVAARVISGSSDSWSSSVVIDHGASSGLAVGMPVVTGNGAVGQIISCSPTTSTVRLLTDELSSVSAMLQGTRAQGMLKGTVEGKLKLALIRTDQTVNVGDMVVTSGLGGVFPKGLPMGKVSVIDSDPGAGYYEIEVEPLTRIGNLEEVLVITSLTEGQQASDEDIANADAADLEAASGHSAKRLVAEGDGGDKEDEESETGEEKQDLQTDEQTGELGSNQIGNRAVDQATGSGNDTGDTASGSEMGNEMTGGQNSNANDGMAGNAG
jgi:rod shape-determining protein MreC